MKVALSALLLLAGLSWAVADGCQRDDHDKEDVAFTKASVDLMQELRTGKVDRERFYHYCLGSTYPIRFGDLHGELCWEPENRDQWNPGWR